jgi:hypothetical protein
LDAWVRGDGIKFESAEAQSKYRERATRFRTALELGVPDRVPVAGLGGAFIYRRAGVPQKATMYDGWADAAKAVIQFQKDFQPDSATATFMMSGASMEFLGQTNMKWAGFGLPDDVQYQYVEQEYMKADEYDHFLCDPSDYVTRKFLPRMYNGSERAAEIPLVWSRRHPDRRKGYRRIHGSRGSGSDRHHEEGGRDVHDPGQDFDGNRKHASWNGFSSLVHGLRRRPL